MSYDETRDYEPPMLVELGTIEDLTHGPPLLSTADVTFFYGGF